MIGAVLWLVFSRLFGVYAVTAEKADRFVASTNEEIERKMRR